MLFNSFEFLLFFPIVTILYFLIPHKGRWLLLLLASCFFYMFFKPIYILILGFTIIVDYFAGILLETTQDKRRKKIYLIMSLVANIGVLAIFKYYNFINENITSIAQLLGYKNQIPYLNILLPIGLSFHTFQAMSYTIEVYRGNQKAERHFGIYSLYVMFYPQLVAGPIERPQNLLHQFHEKHTFDYENVIIGTRQIVWGLFKKSVIADRLALFVDPIFNNPTGYSSIEITIATIFFSFQIYCDFSGYSNIAIGTARIMGIKLMTNFNKPYSAISISEFWRRWHISLSTWLNDYLFNPIALSLSKYDKYALVIAAMITFLISGIWHGAAWTFIVYGALHGLAIVYEIITYKLRKKVFKKLPKILATLTGRFFTYSYLCFAYVFFRAHNLKDALFISKKMINCIPELLKSRNLFSNIKITEIETGFFLIILLVFLQKFEKDNCMDEFFAKQKVFVRLGLLYIFIMSIYVWGVFYNRQFIYFQF